MSNFAVSVKGIRARGFTIPKLLNVTAVGSEGQSVELHCERFLNSYHTFWTLRQAGVVFETSKSATFDPVSNRYELNAFPTETYARILDDIGTPVLEAALTADYLAELCNGLVLLLDACPSDEAPRAQIVQWRRDFNRALHALGRVKYV